MKIMAVIYALPLRKGSLKKLLVLAVNTKVGQLFLLGLFLRHYFVDSNIRNL